MILPYLPHMKLNYQFSNIFILGVVIRDANESWRIEQTVETAPDAGIHQWPFLLTWITFNPSMDKYM